MSGGDKTGGATLRVAAEADGRPLRECVASALHEYLAKLDGHPPGNLYQMVLQEVERPMIEAALRHTGGNQSRAAEVLGMSRGTLRKKLKLYGLDQ